jgi:hypothetical protein
VLPFHLFLQSRRKEEYAACVDGRFGRRPLLQGALAVTGAAIVPRFAGVNAATTTDPLTRSSFSPFVNSTFHVADGGRRVPVVLSRIDDISSTTATTREDRFSLVFRSTKGPSLAQDTRRLSHAGRPTVDLFLVPVDKGGPSKTYQAIIHRRA